MRRTLRRLALTCAIGLLAVGTAGPAVAETGATGGGDGDSTNTPAVTTAEDLDRAEVKLKAAAAWAAAQHGERSVAEYETVRQEYAAKFPNVAGLPAFERQDVSTTSVFYHLDLWQIGQTRSNWCGPATAAMIIRQMYRAGVIPTERSRDGYDRPWTEYELSGPDYLRARTDGTHRDDMRTGLNRWSSPPVGYDVLSDPTFDQWYNALSWSVRTVRQAQAAATYETAGGAHYNGHPSSLDIGHWVPAYGYFETDRNFTDGRFADSATSLWAAPVEYFNYPAKSFVSNFLVAVVW